jgi:hypothetical protein
VVVDGRLESQARRDRPAQAGDDARAIVLAEETLELADTAVGPDHPDVAESLNHRTMVYLALGKYAEVEPLYQRTQGFFVSSSTIRHFCVLSNHCLI